MIKNIVCMYIYTPPLWCWESNPGPWSARLALYHWIISLSHRIRIVKAVTIKMLTRASQYFI